MVDIELIVQQLRERGHVVQSAFPVPSNAGDYELVVDGVTIDLADARALLEQDEAE